MTTEFCFRDPFAGYISEWGDGLEEAIEYAYADIPEEERPTYVWWTDAHGIQRQIPVPGGMCSPSF